MSTRAQIIIKDEYDELWFHRHSDGDPEGTLPTLEKFLNWVKSGRIRDNVQQAAGWLVIIGHHEDLENDKNMRKQYPKSTFHNNPIPYEPPLKDNSGYGWKVGAYEPCAPVKHEDIEYLYTVDLVKKKITYKKI